MSRAGFSYLTKYLSKSTEYKKEDNKSVKTLALCWFFRKRSFTVSGHLSKLYSDLIRIMHNSNKRAVQVSLSGEALLEEKFSVLGFVPIDVVGLGKDVWSAMLSSKQISAVDQFLLESKRGDW
jgi:hypothetical protein